MKNQKGNIALITIIIAIVAISASALTWLFLSQSRTTIQKEVATQTTSPTQEAQSQVNNWEASDVPADWKTYRNEEYGFEFKYPKEWKSPLIKKGEYGQGRIGLGCPEVNMGGEGQCPLQFEVFPASTPEKFLAEEFNPQADLNGKRSEVVYRQMANVKNANFTNVNDYPGSTRYSVFFGDKYYVAFSDYLLNYQENGIFEKIISTFKFNNAQISGAGDNILDNPKISLFHQSSMKDANGNRGYVVEVSNFKSPLWLCVQDDSYSKPDNTTCNSGHLIQDSYSNIFFHMNSEALLVLASDSSLDQIFDEAHVKKVTENDFDISEASKLCGNVRHNEDGSYYMDDTRLLTVPGWKKLIPFINKKACVKGVRYQGSFRVYFVE